MKTIGDAVIDAIIKSDAIESAIHEGDSTLFVWRANAAEQIEAALRDSMEQPTGLISQALTPSSVSDVARANANEAIIEAWGEQIKMVDAWLEQNHPELKDDSGRTCWGVLVDRLYEEAGK